MALIVRRCKRLSKAASVYPAFSWPLIDVSCVSVHYHAARAVSGRYCCAGLGAPLLCDSHCGRSPDSGLRPARARRPASRPAQAGAKPCPVRPTECVSGARLRGASSCHYTAVLGCVNAFPGVSANRQNGRLNTTSSCILSARRHTDRCRECCAEGRSGRLAARGVGLPPPFPLPAGGRIPPLPAGEGGGEGVYPPPPDGACPPCVWRGPPRSVWRARPYKRQRRPERPPKRGQNGHTGSSQRVEWCHARRNSAKPDCPAPTDEVRPPPGKMCGRNALLRNEPNRL